MLSQILLRVLTNLSMAFCQDQQACISGHTLSSLLQNCKVSISVLFISWFFLNAPLLPEYRFMSIPSLNHLSTIQCIQVRKRNRNAIIIDVGSLSSQNSIMERTALPNRFQLGRSRTSEVCSVFGTSSIFTKPDQQWACEYLMQSRVKGCWGPQKIQMGSFNISKHFGRQVLFRASCKLAP